MGECGGGGMKLFWLLRVVLGYYGLLRPACPVRQGFEKLRFAGFFGYNWTCMACCRWKVERMGEKESLI